MLQALQRHVAWRAIPVAGFAAGTVFLLTVLVLTPRVLDASASLILNYFGALVLGSDSLTETTNSDALTGVIVLYVLSLVYALVISIVIHRWGLWVGIVGGAILGLCLYSINFYTLTYFFDWFFAIHSSVMLIAHVLFGAVAGGVYESLDSYDLPLTGEATHEHA